MFNERNLLLAYYVEENNPICKNVMFKQIKKIIISEKINSLLNTFRHSLNCLIIKITIFFLFCS